MKAMGMETSILLLMVFLLNAGANMRSSLQRNERKAESAIVDGEVAQMPNTRFHASIRLRTFEKTFGSGHNCDGSLINPSVVLTAAHCLFIKTNPDDETYSAMDVSEFIVVMGTLNRKVKTNFTITCDVLDYRYHEGFEFVNAPDDIALMFLDCFIPSNHPIIKPIAISSFDYKPGAVCEICGFGATKPTRHAQLSDVLLTATVIILNFSDCRIIYEERIGTRMICATHYTGRDGPCHGDSGSALVCQNVVVGVLSWGFLCGFFGHPAVYTNTFYYRNWIEHNMMTMAQALQRSLNCNCNTTLSKFLLFSTFFFNIFLTQYIKNINKNLI